MVLNNSTLAHRCRREGVHPIINLQSRSGGPESAMPPIATEFHPGREMTLCAKSRHPLYSMTSSALAMIVCGNVRPIDLAVLRLMTSSNFVGS
jgi:hypothetical protein